MTNRRAPSDRRPRHEARRGKHGDIRSRPRLMEAAGHTVEVDATLVIAKLDRMSATQVMRVVDRIRTA